MSVPFTKGKQREVKGNTGKFSGGTGGHTAQGKASGAMVTGKVIPPKNPMPMSQ